MKMKIFNATKEEIKNKKYNIFIGISMGIKPLNTKVAKDYLNWALEHTKDNVIILIADTIAKINYEIFSNYSEGKSYRRALKEGDTYIQFFKNILSEFPKEKKDKIKILRWNDIFSNRLKKMSNVLEDEFLKNDAFRKQILTFVKEYAKRRGKKLDREELNHLAKYMLLELPTMFEGIEFEGIKYKLLFYPTFVDSGMGKFVADIEKRRTFPKLKEKLNLDKKTILAEAYISEFT